MRTLFALGILVTLLPIAGPATHAQRNQAATAERPEANVRPVTQAMLNNPDPADWLMWRRTYNGWGYSPLDQVNRQNVKNLQLVWTYALEPHQQGLQAEPLVHDGVIFTRHPSELLTAHNAATGDLIWQYRRPLPKDVETSGYIAHRGRGLAIFGNKLLNSSTDGYVYALDPRSGRLLWETLIGPSEVTRHQPSGAPTVYNGVVVVPFNCGNNRSLATCHLSAYDAETGKLVWRWYSSPTTGDPLNETWGPEPQKYPREARFNVSPWMTPAVDVEQGLFIFGVGSTAPMQPDIVGSKGTWPDRLFHNSTVALDYRTGRLAWWAQHTSDMHNDDSVYDRLLVDAPVNPTDPNAPWLGRNGSTRPAEKRKLVVGSFSKDGIFYAYDRTNGEFLYARETAPQDVVLSYDGKTGAYRMNPANKLTADTQRVVSACKENRTIPQGAYSPLTNAYYVPVWAGCADFRTTSATPQPRQGYNITTVRSYANPKAPTFGRPEAIDVTTGKTLWRLDRQYPLYGMLTTGGGLVFAADTNRRFYALDQRTGAVLWQTILNGLSDMAPITYSVNGRQYIAVISPGGTSGARGHLERVGIRVPTTGQSIFVFALPQG